MAIKQISVFVENKPGRLADITGFLADGGISIRAFSIADTTDFGILRLIVSDTDKAAKVLKEHGVAVSITEVVGISIPDVTGAFAKVVKLLSDAGENVEYAYAFLTPEEGHAYVISSELIITKKLASTLRKTASMLLKKTLCCNSISLKPGAVASGFFCEFADVFNLLFLFAVIKY